MLEYVHFSNFYAIAREVKLLYCAKYTFPLPGVAKLFMLLY